MRSAVTDLIYFKENGTMSDLAKPTTESESANRSYRECTKCSWMGPYSDCEHPQHDADIRLCPRCLHETVECMSELAPEPTRPWTGADSLEPIEPGPASYDTHGSLGSISRAVEYADSLVLMIENDLVEPAEPQFSFGDRLRHWPIGSPDVGACDNDALADAIDSDRDELEDRLATRLGDALGKLAVEQSRLKLIKTRIEELMEEFSYEVELRQHLVGIIEYEPFMCGLAEIFSSVMEAVVPTKQPTPDATRFEIPGNDGGKGLRVAVDPDGTTFFWPMDPLVGQGFYLSGRAAHDLVMLLGVSLPPIEPTLWTCTNCGKQTTDIIFEEGDSNICRECYDTFEANEAASRARHEDRELPMTMDVEPDTLIDTITESDIDFVEGRD